MDRLKELNTNEVLRIYNSLATLIRYNIPCDSIVMEEFAEELRIRRARPFDEKIGMVIARSGEITHTELLQRCSRYANAGDVLEGLIILKEDDLIEEKEYVGSKGKKGKMYVWKGVPRAPNNLETSV